MPGVKVLSECQVGEGEHVERPLPGGVGRCVWDLLGTSSHLPAHRRGEAGLTGSLAR